MVGTAGLVSGPYGGIVQPMLADLTADTPLLQQIVEQNSEGLLLACGVEHCCFDHVHWPND